MKRVSVVEQMEHRILEALKEHGPMTFLELALKCGVRMSQAQADAMEAKVHKEDE